MPKKKTKKAKVSKKKTVSKKSSVKNEKKAVKSRKIENLRQKKTMQKMSENVGSLKRSMIEAGYSESYAHSGRIKKTKSWKQLVDENISDKLIAEAHRKTLTAKRLLQMNFDEDMPDEEIAMIMDEAGFTVMRIHEAEVEYTNSKGELKSFRAKKCVYAVPDTMSMNKAIDMAYKLKDKYPKEKLDLTVNRPFKDLTDEELAEVISESKKFLRKEK